MSSIGDHVRSEAAREENGDAQAAGNARSRSHGRSRGRRSGKGPKISIPKNWTDVPKMGGVVGASRFVPIRVPLDDKYAHFFQRDPDQQWSPRLFVEEQAAKGLNVRLVIDLTNTLKYYDGAAEFQDTGIEYVKLKIEGFHAPPQGRDVAKFIEIVDAFLAKESSGNVAVHCTHGLNRTGYLVVNYMVQRLGCSVTKALAAFSDARPPGLIKHMYVEDLYRRLGREGEEVQLPTLPDWAAEKYAKRERHH